MFVAFTVSLCFKVFPVEDLLIRPHPQIIQFSEGGLTITSSTRIVIPKGWPVYVRMSAEELAKAIHENGRPPPDVKEIEQPEVKNGNIIVALYEWPRRHLTFPCGIPVNRVVKSLRRIIIH